MPVCSILSQQLRRPTPSAHISPLPPPENKVVSGSIITRHHTPSHLEQQKLNVPKRAKTKVSAGLVPSKGVSCYRPQPLVGY